MNTVAEFTNLKKEIKAWLENPQDLQTGMALLRKIPGKSDIYLKIKRFPDKKAFQKVIFELHKVKTGRSCINYVDALGENQKFFLSEVKE
jgi:hypothetical protein